VEIIHKATNNLFRLLENLLQWSSTQTGEIEYRPEQFDLNSLTMNIIQIMGIHAEKKGISIINSLPENTKAYGDKNLISTVIRNLLSNAVKFTRENGQIRIEGIVKKDEIEIAVIDNGIGINKVDIDKLFRLDCNVTTIGTSEERGSGLGLILCKEFVEKNGGRIWVESEIDIGSSFKFTIPKEKKRGK
jgi:signal transduction histidine kinase